MPSAQRHVIDFKGSEFIFISADVEGIVVNVHVSSREFPFGNFPTCVVVAVSLLMIVMFC